MYSHFSVTYCKDGYLQKDLPWSHFSKVYGQCTALKEWKKIAQVLAFHFALRFSSCLHFAYLEPGQIFAMEVFLRKYLTALRF